MKNKALFVRMIVIGLSYTLCAHLCFALHGMREWPSLLLGTGCFALAFSWLYSLPWLGNAAAGGYLIAFGVACFLRTDGTDPGGGVTNNLWMIWATVYVVLLLIGLGIDLIKKKRGA